jgi:hypothetical protein
MVRQVILPLISDCAISQLLGNPKPGAAQSSAAFCEQIIEAEFEVGEVEQSKAAHPRTLAEAESLAKQKHRCGGVREPGVSPKGQRRGEGEGQVSAEAC